MGSDAAPSRCLFSRRLFSARPVANAPPPSAPASRPTRSADSVWSLFAIERDSDDAGGGDVGGGDGRDLYPNPDAGRDRDRDRDHHAGGADKGKTQRDNHFECESKNEIKAV